jgi:hypothetical protein
MRIRLTMFFLISGECFIGPAQSGSSTIQSARIENVATIPDKGGIRFGVRNIGERQITAFSAEFYVQSANGERIPCGGRGMDMIDWSDPMPGRGIYVHMRRNWLPPNGIGSLDGYPSCPGGPTPLELIQVELNLIMFDNGTAEGESQRIESTLVLRQQARDERLKWMGRLTALRNASELKLSAQSLYQDLVDATRAAEINVYDASREGMAKPVREELQNLALDITQWAAHGERLDKSEFLSWRITDLEQRTARLTRGAGNVHVNRY